MTGVYRPRTFAEFNGHGRTVKNLRVTVRSAVNRDAPVPHVLLTGGPGLGKTTLASIIAHERGTKFEELNGAAIEMPKDLVAPLITLEKNDILFIDEIHSIKPSIMEFLYTAMEDHKITIPTNDDGGAVTTALNPFTLIGATTREGILTGPLLDRFMVRERLDLYDNDSMMLVILWTMDQFKARERVSFDAAPIANYLIPFCHGTARFVQRFLGAMRDTLFASDEPSTHIDLENAKETMARLGYNDDGYGGLEQKYLSALSRAPKGLGLNHLCELLGEDGATLERTIEPWLLRVGLIQRTPSGRKITKDGERLVRRWS